jgi:mono/diheme cytochrome c family protein
MVDAIRALNEHGGVPGYWMHETGDVLRPAVRAYLFGAEMTPQQIGAVRAYLRQWMAAPWQTPMLDVLRTQINDIETRRDLDRWYHRALDAGIDPL